MIVAAVVVTVAGVAIGGVVADADVAIGGVVADADVSDGAVDDGVVDGSIAAINYSATVVGGGCW